MVTEQPVELNEIETVQIAVNLPAPHSEVQRSFISCIALRQVGKIGRRGGKSVGNAIKGAMSLLGICPVCWGGGCDNCNNSGKVPRKRVLYATPTVEQLGSFWYWVVKILQPMIDAKILVKNENEYTIEYPGTEYRIKGKTAWNANTLRGDWADLLILDEFQLMNEDAWAEVGQPMLADRNGIAVFTFTPPSLKSEGVTKAKDPRHASKLYDKHQNDPTGRWKCFHWTSYDNPLLSREAIDEMAKDSEMSQDSFRREIMAEDDEIQTSWLVYSKFNKEFCNIKRFTIPEHWPIYSGHDFGTANPAALFAAQVRVPLPPGTPPYLRYGDYVLFSEYAPGPGTSAVQHIDKFMEICGRKKDGSIRKPDESLGGNITTEEQTRQLYTRLGWSIHAPKFSKVNLQVDRVLALMEANQIFIFDDLHQLLYEIDNCMWVIDSEKRTTNKIKDEARYHLLACLRYLATALVPKQPAGERRGAPSWTWP